jgi:hypothetical protein
VTIYVDGSDQQSPLAPEVHLDVAETGVLVWQKED